MTEQPQQGQVLAVHTSQLTTANMEQLVQQGYGILPDQSGWLIFARVAPERDRSHDVRRLAPYVAGAAEPSAPGEDLSPGAQRLAPDGSDTAHVRVDEGV